MDDFPFDAKFISPVMYKYVFVHTKKKKLYVNAAM